LIFPRASRTILARRIKIINTEIIFLKVNFI
jgi:hypothetical protein